MVSDIQLPDSAMMGGQTIHFSIQHSAFGRIAAKGVVSLDRKTAVARVVVVDNRRHRA
jgi:hypothetical protein